jgi:predicted ABC-type ATPase
VSAPILTIIAGTNGCGKSTLTKWARAFFQQTATLDPDAVAVELQAETSGEVSPIEAGKQVLLTAESYLQKGVSFSVDDGHRVIALKLEGRDILLFEPVPAWAAFPNS